MNCPHQSRAVNHGPFTCAIGKYGGSPFKGQCNHCLSGKDELSDCAGCVRESPNVIQGVRMAKLGPAIWNRLHRYAATWDGNLQQQADCLAATGKDTLCQPCREFWDIIVSEIPAPSTGAAAFFSWTVSMHNAVNQKLNKPAMSLEEASALYGLEMGSSSVIDAGNFLPRIMRWLRPAAEKTPP